MARFTKADVEFHSERFGGGRRPAVNVKVRDSLEDGFAKFLKANDDVDARFTCEWVREHVSDETLDARFQFACEDGFERLADEAREIWGADMYEHRGARRHRVNVYSEGRSGGWAVVDGIDDDVDSWDAIQVAKWGRFARFARLEADDVMYRVVDGCYFNDFECWREELSEVLGGAAFAPETLALAERGA